MKQKTKNIWYEVIAIVFAVIFIGLVITGVVFVIQFINLFLSV